MIASGAKFTTAEAAEIIGIGRRGLDDLTRRKIVLPTHNRHGRGQTRYWTFADLVAVRCGLEWLRAAGAGWIWTKRLVRYVQRMTAADLEKHPLIAMDLHNGRAWACEEGATFEGGPSMRLLICDLRPGVAVLTERAYKVRPDLQPQPEAAA